MHKAACFLIFLVLLVPRIGLAQCAIDLLLDDEPISVLTSFTAQDTISTGNNFGVTSTGNLSLQAGISVSLAPNFSVDQGGVLEINIAPAGNDCADPPLTTTVYRSCAHALQEGQTTSGVYLISATGAEASSVFCDQDVDGGGWTLVGSSTTTMNDEASAFYADLSRIAPADTSQGIWDGLRPLGQRFDVRFACRDDDTALASDPMTVDLSFFDVPWYDEFTTGTDADSCFSESNGAFDDSKIPARRDNLTGRFRSRGDTWEAGFLEGEDACGDTADFTVDFDNRGMDSNQGDGTDWGEDDGTRKCGLSGVASGQWFVFARERPRVAVVGLSAGVTNVLQDSGLLADAFSYDPQLPARLTTENYDTIVIGRYAFNWPAMTQELKEALDTFGRNGGNVVTEWEGASIFNSAFSPTYRYSAGAPAPLGWTQGATGAGSGRGFDTPITPVNPGDPIFEGVTTPVQGGGATDFFFTMEDDLPATLDMEVVATFPGNGSANFPAGDLGAIYRGRYCDGQLLYANFDWQDDPDNPGLGPLVANMVNATTGPPSAGLGENCMNAIRPNVLQCGSSLRNIDSFNIGGTVVQSCVPDSNTQAMFVTRTGAAQLDGVQLRAYLQNGGIVITEFNISDEVFNLAFLTDVTQGATRFGVCQDAVMPLVRFNESDGFWQDNAFEPPAANAAGCGFSMAGFPNIVPLGGWTEDAVSLAYRDLGAGRLWLVDIDWQDTQQVDDATLGLLRYMALHGAGGELGRGLSEAGVQQNRVIHDYIQGDFEVCYSGAYNEGESLDTILTDCHEDVLMLACRETGNDILYTSAMGERSQVTADTGTGNVTTPHNSVEWYFNQNRSWGFAPDGETVTRNSCDTTSQSNDDRLCWHTSGNQIASGWRCGSNTNLFGNTWERIVLQRKGTLN